MPKMGRGIKVLLCSFCLDRSPDRATNEQSFSQGIDVSHLATPHSSYNLPSAALLEQLPANSSLNCNEENSNNYSPQYNSLVNNCNLPPSRATPDRIDGRENSTPINQDRQQQQQQHQSDNNQPLPSPHSSTSGSNIYEQSQDDEHQAAPHDNADVQNPQQQQQQPLHYDHDQVGQIDNNGNSTKLSYDIISVREPLAKILAERQLLHQAQQQQRQILGDHEYIEVYGERGSSCFYEEIAGSTTSSATYDQIGSVSNHNYQALINAYAVTNRANRDKSNDNQENDRNDDHDVVDNSENIYNLTETPNNDHSHNQQNSSNPIPSTSYNRPSDDNFQNRINQNNSSTDRNNSLVTESVPVYSVINKATRRNNQIRSPMDNCRPPPPPPPPPPKNLTMANNQHPSTSAIPHYQQSSVLLNTRSNSSKIPTPSSSIAFRNSIDNNNDDNSEHREVNENIATRLPQPPPRYSKHPMFDATKRPLPLPDNHQILHNNNNNSTSNLDDDLESLNNGYELLTNANFNDDVGYEKIKETHQYSGGSISSQLNPLQLLDNEGYESVQPIYSSPSNALVEPNYEAIGPATASELAASATARLNAAVAVIDYLKQDQP